MKGGGKEGDVGAPPVVPRVGVRGRASPYLREALAKRNKTMTMTFM